MASWSIQKSQIESIFLANVLLKLQYFRVFDVVWEKSGGETLFGSTSYMNLKPTKYNTISRATHVYRFLGRIAWLTSCCKAHFEHSSNPIETLVKALPLLAVYEYEFHTELLTNV